MSGLFLDRLVDWQAFESFVRDLYAIDENVVAERDVTEVGLSGAPRQTDVKLTQVIDGQPEVTLVECKRWKARVDRSRIDILAASVEDLGARRGVMFTTSGYESGAEAYAKHKGIEIFVVRDLTDDEWGQPGRVVWFYLHYYGGGVVNVNPGQQQLFAIVEQPPTRLDLALVVEKDKPHDPSMTLYSARDGSPGPNLVSLVIEARNRALELLSRSIGVWDAESEGETKAFAIPLELDLREQPHRQLLRGYGAIRFERLSMVLLATVTQSRFEYDRGMGFDLALAVENYVTRHRQIASRGNTGDLAVFDLQVGSPPDPAEVLQNGTLMKVFLEPWVAPPKVSQAILAGSLTFELPDWNVSVVPSAAALAAGVAKALGGEMGQTEGPG